MHSPVQGHPVTDTNVKFRPYSKDHVQHTKTHFGEDAGFILSAKVGGRVQLKRDGTR